MSSKLRSYVGIVCIAAVLALVGLVPRVDLDRFLHAWPTITMFTVLLVIGEFFPIEIRHRDQAKSIVPTYTFAFGLVPVAGVAIAVLAHMAATLIRDLARRKALIKVVFNAAQYVLALTVGGLVYMVSGGGMEITPRSMPAYIAGAAVFTLLNWALVNT